MASATLVALSWHDMADHIQEFIIKDPESRTTEAWSTMKEFYDEYTKRLEVEEDPGKDSQRQWGRLYMRLRMCQILVRACAWSPYDFDEPTALVNWKENHWTELIELLSENADQCDDAEKLYNKVVSSCKLHRSLAAIRCMVEREIYQRDGGSIKIKTKTVKKLIASVQKGGLEVESRAHHLFGNLDSNEEAPCLRPINHIKRTFQTKPFSFIKLQKRIEKLIFWWNYLLFHNQEAELWSIGYNLPKCFQDSELSCEIDVSRFQQTGIAEQGQRSRSLPGKPSREETLRRTKSPDRKPRVRSPRRANAKLQLTPSKKRYLPRQTTRRHSPYWTEEGSFRKKRRESPFARRRQSPGFNSPAQTSITGLDFSDCDTPTTRRSATSISSTGRGPVTLGGIPSRVNAMLHSGRGPDRGRFTEAGHVRRRIKWSAEEEKALRVGIKKHGLGSWAVIKDDFEDTFRNRTSVMLKDKYRNLLRNGAIDSDGESVASQS